MGVETWLLGMIFMALRCVMTAAIPNVSEAYSHYDSATTLYSSDNYLKCTSDHQVTVTSTDEIQDLIKRYASRAHPVKIRATRRGFHSSMGFVCAGSRGSSLGEYNKLTGSTTTSITVLLHLMNRVVAVDGYQMTVEAGMTLLELAQAAEAHGLSVPVGALSIYANLTVGGVILTSAHGSGYRTTSSLGDLVTSLKWVNAKGEVLVHNRGAREFRALVGGLGLLGIVTEVTLQLQPNSRTIVELRKGLNDARLVSELMQIVETETPHVLAFWRPDFGTYRATLWTEVEDYDPARMPRFYPNGSIAFLTPTEEGVTSTLKEVMAAWEDDVRDESPSAVELNADVCLLSQVVSDESIFQDGTGTLLDVATIPTNNAIVSTDCGSKCQFHVHHTGAFLEDTEFTLKLSQLSNWVRDVKHVVKTELAAANSRSNLTGCMSPGFFWIRFGQGNANLLSTSTGSEDVVYVQWSYTHSALVPNKPSKMSTIGETLEQLTLCKYKGRPHWGKNHERVVRHPQCKVRENFPAWNVAEMVRLQQEHDPWRVFEPELFTEMMEKRGPDYSPLCTPHFWCYCASDEHCPSGFRCRGSGSFAEYKVCRLVDR